MTLGAGDRARANQYFSMLVYVTAIAGVVLAAAVTLCCLVIQRKKYRYV